MPAVHEEVSAAHNLFNLGIRRQIGHNPGGLDLYKHVLLHMLNAKKLFAAWIDFMDSVLQGKLPISKPDTNVNFRGSFE